MKKILFFICTLDDGGAQRVVSTISSCLADRGFDVEILKYYKSNNIYPIKKNVKIDCVEEQTKTNNIIKNIWFIHNYFRKKTDVVISFLAPYNIIALIANIGNRTPIIVADRNDPKKVPTNMAIRKIRNILYRRTDYVVVQTENNKRYFNHLNNCVVIENPINMGDFLGKALIENKKNIISSAGRLMPQKNHLLLIDAFAEVHKKYKDYKLVIFGDGNEYKKILEERIIKLGLIDAVMLPGSSNDLFNELSKTKMFVLTSNYEGMPNALAEAMCLGLPVISTKVSGSNELIKDNFNGYLIDIGDKNSLIEKIIMLIEDDNKRDIVAKNAIEIGKKLSQENIVSKWIELINMV